MLCASSRRPRVAELFPPRRSPARRASGPFLAPAPPPPPDPPLPSARARPRGCTTTSAARSTATASSSPLPPPCSWRCAREPFTDKDGARLQWHHFRVTGAGGSPEDRHRQRGRRLLPRRVARLQGVLSADRVNWHRISTTSYEDGALIIDFDAVLRCVRLGISCPTLEKHLDLVASRRRPGTCPPSSASPSTAARHCLRFGRPGAWTPRCSSRGTLRRTRRQWSVRSTLPWEREERQGVVWIIGRQHPGDHGIVVDGRFHRASSRSRGSRGEEGVAPRDLYVVPNMNPDGAVEAISDHAAAISTASGGAVPERPRRFPARAAVDATGPVDLMLDVHGDEAEPLFHHRGGDARLGRASRRRPAISRPTPACPDFKQPSRWSTDPRRPETSSPPNAGAPERPRPRPTRPRFFLFPSPPGAVLSRSPRRRASAGRLTDPPLPTDRIRSRNFAPPTSRSP